MYNIILLLYPQVARAPVVDVSQAPTWFLRHTHTHTYTETVRYTHNAVYSVSTKWFSESIN